VAWVVDTCLLIDVAVADPAFGRPSANLLVAHQNDGLAVCPVTYIELAPVFGGDRLAEEQFLAGVGVVWPEAWTLADSLQAHAAWATHVRQKRQGAVPKRPIADILIGAFALRFQGLLSRNAADFRTEFPGLKVVEP
jgi:predicted nucleic acid-binding protein